MSAFTKSEIKRRALFAACLVLIAVVGVALFRAKSWAHVKYHPTDGLAMLVEVENRFHDDRGGELTFHAITDFPKPREIIKFTDDEVTVSIVYYHYKKPLLPRWLKWTEEMVGRKELTCEIDRYSSEYRRLTGDFDPKATLKPKELLQYLKTMDANTELYVNEDFVSIRYEKEVRVYARARISKRMKTLLHSISTEHSWGVAESSAEEPPFSF